MICSNCKAWSGPAEFSCYNCGESFCPGSEGTLTAILILLLALFVGAICAH